VRIAVVKHGETRRRLYVFFLERKPISWNFYGMRETMEGRGV
jgi:hypothetical protein